MIPENVKPVRQSGDATGGPETKISKPMDKPRKQYLANENVPQDSFHEEPLAEDFENPGDLSKRFSS